MTEEELDAGRLKCSKCKFEKVNKKFKIIESPKILCLHLKRFRWDPPKRTKITTPLSIPLELNLEDYCTDLSNSHYELYSTISHHGSK